MPDGAGGCQGCGLTRPAGGFASGFTRADPVPMTKKPKARSARAASVRNALAGYAPLLADLKQRVRQTQVRAALAASAEMIGLYWQIGQLIARVQEKEGWGTGVIPRLAADLHAEFPEMEGFSERNLKRMIRFYREYAELDSPIVPQAAAQLAGPEKGPQLAAQLLEGSKVQQPVAQLSGERVPQPVAQLVGTGPTPILQQAAAKLPWFHHVILIERVKDRADRFWYMQQAVVNGWSRSMLAAQIKAKAHRASGKAITNFAATLPPAQSDLAQQALKDPYFFDFLTLGLAARERDLEQGLIDHIQKFLVTLGVGFAFVGRQYHISVGGQDYYLDLLFYHLKLRCFFVIDLKVEAFKPEFAGKMNFYLSAVDAQLRHKDDQPTIGLLLCQENNRITVEYALRDVKKPIGVAQWKTRLVDSLPKNLRGALPTVAQIERELAEG
jgi:predicted nuclease of restriction endonuclease-like (RecB) superfamily